MRLNIASGKAVTGVIAALVTSACGGTADQTNMVDAPTGQASNALGAQPERTSAPTSVPKTGAKAAEIETASAPARVQSSRPTSCSADIGAAAAARRVAICSNVSPATHPPCNAANSCAMIEDEIARSCALFDGKGAPMAGCGPAPKGMEAAAAVVRRYYSAINAHDYATAWSQWGEGGATGQSRGGFAAGFAHTRSTRVTIGTLEPGSGGAGSIYQPIPVTVDATLDDGIHQVFRGSYIVRRVNDVDGATPAQLRWHIASARLVRVAAR